MDCPPVAFLGVSEVFNIQRNIDPRFRVFNIAGLRMEIISSLYPLPLSSLKLVFAIYDFVNLAPFDILFISQGKEIFTVHFGAEVLEEENLKQPHGGLDEMLMIAEKSWIVTSFAFAEEQFPFAPGPMMIEVKLKWKNTEAQIGTLNFFYIRAAQLTPERIIAIKSDPQAVKSARFGLKCKKCQDEIKFFTALEKSDIQDEFTWYQNLPDAFVCKCSATNISLQFIKESFHSVLGKRFGQVRDQIFLSKLYGKAMLEETFERFKDLLESTPDEEQVQQFLNHNPILFHQFSPELVIPKAPLLNKYVSDYLIPSKSSDLYFIEIESPQKKILKKDGVTAEFTHAFTQVRDWIHLFNNHRAACVEMIGLSGLDIGGLRGIVIIGRSQNEDGPDLIKHKSFDQGAVTFLTYDDLLESLGSLIAHFK